MTCFPVFESYFCLMYSYNPELSVTVIHWYFGEISAGYSCCLFIYNDRTYL